LGPAGVDLKYHNKDDFPTITDVMGLQLNSVVAAIMACPPGVRKGATWGRGDAGTVNGQEILELVALIFPYVQKTHKQMRLL